MGASAGLNAAATKGADAAPPMFAWLPRACAPTMAFTLNPQDQTDTPHLHVGHAVLGIFTRNNQVFDILIELTSAKSTRNSSTINKSRI